MTRGAWMRRQTDEGCAFSAAPRETEQPFTESERAQRWRRSLASLLFITVLLSDHLWFCAEAKSTRTRDKRSGHEGEEDAIFLGNSTKPLRRTACHPDSLSKDCLTSTDAAAACMGLSRGGARGTRPADVNLSDLYLSFCNSYSLLDLFYGVPSPGEQNCTLDVAAGAGCKGCVEAYRELDRRAEEDYREFELLVDKYETDAYSVSTCMDECKVRLYLRTLLGTCFYEHPYCTHRDVLLFLFPLKN
uniref:NALCN channel auxiliary factor 1 n=1 Tax=Gadus morhua TaxID=8049 RepID=A0A8C5F4F8_GADMO